MSAEPVFEAVDGRIVATELASGPWNPNSLHGGAPAALIVRAFERLPARAGLCLARVTCEFLRPVPVGPLEVRADVARPGRRVELLEGSIAAEGVEVVRARALRIMAADAGRSHSDEIAPPPGPAQGHAGELPGLHRPRFATDAIEIRFIAGGFGGGPATAWFRLTRPLVGDESPSPLQRLAAASDFGAGLSATLPRSDYLFINVDLTAYIEREPVGEWICLDSRTRIATDGIGLTESVLYDERGRVGRATQALLVARHPSARTT
ncbi:MAG TPA: thioesterase family protein [Solirubrobacteraceae bacterium]|nr:thioesterase family protein [Solirubrobacteraceae bacterium]